MRMFACWADLMPHMLCCVLAMREYNIATFTDISSRSSFKVCRADLYDSADKQDSPLKSCSILIMYVYNVLLILHPVEAVVEFKVPLTKIQDLVFRFETAVH